MGNYRARAMTELTELRRKIDALSKFILGTEIDKLPAIEQADLKEQLKHMQAYCGVLSDRVGRMANSA